jgi:uncharacterized protein YuzE
VTTWTYDEMVIAQSMTVPAAAIYLIPPEDGRPVHTVDLMGAHVCIDVDKDGNVASIEIMGPAVFMDLRDLGKYLGEPATVLTEKEETGEEGKK